MNAENLLFRIAIATILLCSLSLGGLDQSGNSGAENLTISEFSSLDSANDLKGTFVDTGAPLATSQDAGTEIAAYTEQAPPVTDLKTLMPSAVLKSPPRYMYYNGDYLAWNDFTATYPLNNPGLWIERAVGWTQYATLPWGGWARELIYVPQTSPITMYEIYPGGYVLGYSLGLIQSGYYYIWYYADSPGRHRSLFAANSGYSNAVIIDVYSPTIPKPTPDPKRECEARSSDTQTCEWRDGSCQCYMKPAPNPVADCEKKQGCFWADGECQCPPGPVPNPVNECESNPTCDYINGQCLCRGLDPEPMPGPVPNPNPEPEPEPFNPAPNPVADCPDGCYWDNGRCNCMGLGGDTDYSNNGGEDADLTVAE
ncbi:MAG: hypothetical protein WCW68_09710 [Methanothrix sp.]